MSSNNKRKQPETSEEKKFKVPRTSNEKENYLNKPENENKKPDLLNDTFSSLFNSNHIDVIFDEIENSIFSMGQESSKASSISDETLDIIFNTSFTTKCQNDSLIPNSLAPNNESCMELSFGTLFKNALLANANKSTVLENSLSSIVEENLDMTYIEQGDFYGLDSKVKTLLKEHRGIEELYDWQDECLSLPSIANKTNLIYALPTSGGKTLVAEILVLRELLCYKRNALFVLPFVAIVQEKVWSLSPFAVALDFLVEEYAGTKGSYPPRKRRKKKSLYIATIEKAHGLINSLIENDRLNELGLIVIDEIHLIGEQGRGATLESLLTKITYLKPNIQIIGMSATIGNISELSEFLTAEVYVHNFRPVELREFVKCGDQMAEVNWGGSEESLLTFKKEVTFKYSESVKRLDPDKIGGLVMQVIPKDSCLIFCPTKKHCENLAQLLTRILFPSLKDVKKEEKRHLKSALQAESGLLCNILESSVLYGVAYHHSGLTNDERRIIEDGFRDGILSVICCTSTLAAGVNLPAKRVILRSPYIGRDFITLSRYKQMVGRAGRAGLGEVGESILICTPQDLKKVTELFESPMDKAISSIHEDNGKGLLHLLLSCVALGIANTRTELQSVTKSTLWACQNKNDDLAYKKLTDQVIKQLFKMGALQTTDLSVNKENATFPDVSLHLETTFNSNESIVSEASSQSSRKQRILVTKNMKLVISKLGLAATKGGLELSLAHIVYEDLLQAQEGMVLMGPVHLLYLIIPYDLANQIRPDMSNYYTIYSQLNANELQTAKILGFTELIASKMITNKEIKNISKRVLNRFYLTLLLHDLWNGMPLFSASEKYCLDRGLVQNLMQASAAFAFNVINFCKELEEFWPFEHLLDGISQRLTHCCVRELLPLMELPAVKQNRAKQLYNAGFKTLQSIAKSNIDELVRNIEHLPRQMASQLIAASKMLLLEKVDNLREEAEDVISGVSI